MVNKWLHATQGLQKTDSHVLCSKSLYQTAHSPANVWKFNRNHIEQTALECASNRIVPCAHVKRKVHATPCVLKIKNSCRSKNGMRAMAGRRQSVRRTLLIMARAYPTSEEGMLLGASQAHGIFHLCCFVISASCHTSYIVHDLYRLCKWL